MPCYDSRSNNYGDMLEDAQQQWNHNSTVAEMLCSACKALEGRGIHLHDVHRNLEYWWADHKERDRKRAAAAKRAKEHEIGNAKRNLELAQKRVNDLLKGKKA